MKTEVQIPQSTAPGRFLTVKQFSEKYAWPMGGLRHLIFYENENGFHAVVRRIGRKILLNEEAFLLWVEDHGCKGRSAR